MQLPPTKEGNLAEGGQRRPLGEHEATPGKHLGGRPGERAIPGEGQHVFN